jgi:hypothetical protein
MGNIQSVAPAPKKKFMVERIIAANCEFLPSEEKNILIGVSGISRDEMNPLAHQAIRLGNSELYKLVNFQEGTSTLTYEFEKNVSLNIMRSKDKLIYNIKTPELHITREIDPMLVKFYKPIGMASAEFDKIEKLYHTQTPSQVSP